MEQKDIIIKNINVEIAICPYCLGTGELKAMQSMTTYDGSIRGKDIKVKCKHCEGNGILI